MMPLHYILKNALFEVEATARRFILAQFDTWKENREELVKWIESMERNNSLNFRPIINPQDDHSNENYRQSITQSLTSDQVEKSQVGSNQSPHSLDQYPLLDLPLKRVIPYGWDSQHYPDGGETADPNLALSVALNAVWVGNTSSTSQLVHTNSISRDLPLNERSHQEAVRQLIPNQDMEETTKNDSNTTNCMAKSSSNIHVALDSLIPGSIVSRFSGIDLIQEAENYQNHRVTNDGDSPFTSMTFEPGSSTCTPTRITARHDNGVGRNPDNAISRNQFRQSSLSDNREGNSELGEWRASHTPP
ncbi:hypothetical protein R1flu_008115 [Riccia fluitans]|uniref:Uncharacterized protein n=1 Tax=Riccia fluitans TaxID=41844 RepID=A0ABD1YBF4_9MARC